MFDAILHKEPTGAAQLNIAVPVELQRIIDKVLEKDRELRYKSAAELRTDLKRLKRDSGSGKLPRRSGDVSVPSGAVAELAKENRTSSVIAPQASVRAAWKRYALLAAPAILLAAGFVAHHFWPRSNSPSAPTKITQISHWNKAMYTTRLSPDGHAVAFLSPVGGIFQVFLMLTSGGEPLQLTNDENDKLVWSFSPDGKEVYYRGGPGMDEVWVVPALGAGPHRVLSVSARSVVPSLDGASFFYRKDDRSGIFRAEKSGLNEQLVYKPEDTSWYFEPRLLFPGGNDLLAVSRRADSPTARFYRINLTSHEAVDLGEVYSVLSDVAWAEQGNSVLFTRMVNGLMNIWKYSLKDRSLTQITFGPGPDMYPMPDSGGRGIYFVNGKPSGFMTVYHVNSKESTDIVSEDVGYPAISPDGKRLMYVTSPGLQRPELWASNIDGSNKAKIATGGSLGTGAWAPDNFHLSFTDASKVYIASADGSSLRQAPPMGGVPWSAIWSSDQKSVYVSSVEKTELIPNIWRWNTENSSPEKLLDNCCMVTAADHAGGYLLGVALSGEKEKAGIYEVSISTRKCMPLLPGVETPSVTFARDGKSFLYAVASRREVTVYRQPWGDGKIIGKPQVALKVPFAFSLSYRSGNAYDLSSDLSTIVYVRPSAHAELYLLSQK